MADGDLTTLANVRSYVSIGDADTDLVQRLITGASDYFRSRIGRDLQSPVKTYTGERHSGDGRAGIFTDETPVTEMTSVVVDGDTIPQAVDPGAGDKGWVLIDADAGRIELIDYLFEVGTGNVLLTYKAGYAAIPAEIEQAIIEMVVLKYRERPHLGLSSETLAGQSAVFLPAFLPRSVEEVVDLYRRIAP